MFIMMQSEAPRAITPVPVENMKKSLLQIENTSGIVQIRESINSTH